MKSPILVLLALVAAPLQAQVTEPALTGLDPVALCEGEELPGQAELTATHGRYTYRFATPESRARFVADPERWGIQWGGGCARMGPLSGRGAPDRWAVHEGRVYIFASDGCREGFLTAPERFVERSDGVVSDPVAIEEGRVWLERVIAAHGGAAAIDARRALHLSASGESDGWKSDNDLVATAEGHVRRTSSWTPPEESEPSLEIVWVVAESAFTCEDDEVHDLASAEERGDTLRYAHRQLLPLFWARHQHGFVPISRGPGLLDGRVTADLLVVSQGLTTTLHIDPDTSRILGLSWRGRVVDGASRDVREIFSAFETLDGVVVPTARKVMVDGDETASFAWSASELLPSAPPGTFERPKR